jgi:hypothetical protein
MLTRNTGQELPSEALDVRVGERNKAVALQKIEQAQVEKVRDDTDMATEVETVPEMDTPVSIVRVVVPERLQCPQLNLGGVAVLLHGADNLHGDVFAGTAIIGLDYLPEGALAEEVRDTICKTGQY